MPSNDRDGMTVAHTLQDRACVTGIQHGKASTMEHPKGGEARFVGVVDEHMSEVIYRFRVGGFAVGLFDGGHEWAHDQGGVAEEPVGSRWGGDRDACEGRFGPCSC
mmetsp:Transcript_10892/g.22688  ORF Transcript_10892/g.22688 Transcript_10892/m.22688 type:complete len:106 (-) Transcript_10892:107-424(-)